MAERGFGDGAAGGELAAAIRRGAADRGVPLREFMAPLSPNPITWLEQLSRATRPKPHTIARVRALLAGEQVPQPPPNNFQKNAAAVDAMAIAPASKRGASTRPREVSEGMTGAEIVALLRRAAADRGESFSGFVKPLTRDGSSLIRQLRRAESPKPHTIARIRALLHGDPIPPPLTHSRAHNRAGRPDPAVIPPRIAPRDPCPRCGIRADIGCRHSWRSYFYG